MKSIWLQIFFTIYSNFFHECESNDQNTHFYNQKMSFRNWCELESIYTQIIGGVKLRSVVVILNSSWQACIYRGGAIHKRNIFIRIEIRVKISVCRGKFNCTTTGRCHHEYFMCRLYKRSDFFY